MNLCARTAFCDFCGPGLSLEVLGDPSGRWRPGGLGRQRPRHGGHSWSRAVALGTEPCSTCGRSS